jgi:putative endonuclease
MERTFNTRTDGSDHESVALNYLLRQGYRLVHRNFHLGRSGEIDLVMRDGRVWVFIEVKGRRTHTYGLPEDAVNQQKRRQIRRIAEGFVQINNLVDYEARFDVVVVDYATSPHKNLAEIRHHKDAFH